jgi:ribosomal protein S27AE
MVPLSHVPCDDVSPPTPVVLLKRAQGTCEKVFLFITGITMEVTFTEKDFDLSDDRARREYELAYKGRVFFMKKKCVNCGAHLSMTKERVRFNGNFCVRCCLEAIVAA